MKQFDLKETQQLLWKLLTAPEGVKKALQDFGVSELPIRGDQRLSNAERLDIYANMYFFRIRDSLKEDFPAVLKILGETGFHNLITDYLIKHPPSHWSLRYAGEHLPLFLQSHSSHEPWAFLPELAQLEWTLLDVFDAPDGEPLKTEQLSRFKPEQWGQLILRRLPATRLLECRWNVDQIREEVRKEKNPHPKNEPVPLKIWRHNLAVFYRRAEPLEATLLRQLADKTTLAHLCETAAQALTADQAAVEVARYLKNWIRQGILERLDP